MVEKKLKNAIHKDHQSSLPELSPGELAAYHITDISKVPGLFVIARNSVFIYKNKTVKITRRGLCCHEVVTGIFLVANVTELATGKVAFTDFFSFASEFKDMTVPLYVE